jgi:lipopolysaccharide/colanic/teichoic acid biosynthesis glycosyltransferase
MQLRREPQVQGDVVPYPFAKRIVDKLIATLLLIFVSPLLVVAAAAAAIASGRVFAREERISRGRLFPLLKFRSTKPGEAELTWAGRRLLRPWYLDELPQLLNVLRGDMSLVGPRPWPLELVEAQIASGRDYRARIMAGLTGPAQVTKGVEGTDYEQLDRAYVDRCMSLGGWALARYDLRILAQTLRVLARGEGLNY